MPRVSKLTLTAGLALIGILLWYTGSYFAPNFSSSLATSKRPSLNKGDARIAIVTFTTEQRSFTHLSLLNHQHYTQRQGYDLIIDYEQHNSRGAMWHKFVMIERAIATAKYDWIWWMDFDTLITNTSKPLTEVIDYAMQNKTRPDAIDFIFTADCFELNAGSFLTRAIPRSIEFFDRVRRYHTANSTDEHQFNEQDCMRDIIFRTRDFEDRLTFVPQWMMNAFPEEIKCWDEAQRGWEPGMLAIHFAGAWAHVKEDDATGFLMKKYEPHIIWGPTSESDDG